jgi:hypothetical protein
VSIFTRKPKAAAPFEEPPATHRADQSQAPGLTSLVKEAAVSLDKKGLLGTRAAVYLVADRSGSMVNHYSSGAIQRLAEQTLGLSANLDDDGIVPVIFFDNVAYPAVEVSLDDYRGVIAREHQRLGQMGGTRYDVAIEAVIKHYTASRATDPAFVVFQTDGEPNRGTEGIVETAIRQAATLPIFWQFVGFGHNFAFLESLDELDGRVIDNAGFFAVGDNPGALSDGDLYDRLMGEFPQWLAAARAQGIVTTP